MDKSLSFCTKGWFQLLKINTTMINTLKGIKVLSHTLISYLKTSIRDIHTPMVLLLVEQQG